MAREKQTSFVLKRRAVSSAWVVRIGVVMWFAVLLFPGVVSFEAATAIAMVAGFVPSLLPAFQRWLHGPSGLGTTWGRAGTILVGSDGVAIGGGRRERFISYADLASVRAQGIDQVRLGIDGRDDVVLGCERPEALEAAIEAARIAYEAAEPSNVAVVEGLDRRAARREGAYREEPVTEAALLEVADDPKAPAEARRRAFEALADAGPRVRARLRVAAEEVAEPVLREELKTMGGAG